ncbi:hypothetical protein [Trinickia diaoshuihuensis]|uniref:hypothetical protein n=1 Tax=Trinickia diaoshuihuensis TaxID=2292265 RepID=UPI001F078C36|nr:hypothetical protein [Trinickia diaoshuihuensis]
MFFSRYGERNRVLEEICVEHLTPRPDIVEMPVRVRTRLPDSERGIFILNALWKVPISEIAGQLPALSAILDELAHINTDVGDDHAGEMWRILRYLIREEADVEKVLRYFDDIQTILAMYFRELYEATIDTRAAA